MATIDLNDLTIALGQIILRFRVRRRTAAEWVTLNEVLLSAEIGLESDTDKFKFGDGTTPWNGLEYAGGGDPFTLGDRNAGVGIAIDEFQPTTGGTGGDYATDTHFADRLCVVHFDGLNTDGTAIDSGPLGSVITAVGTGTALSATQSVFGGMSSHGDAGGTVDRTGWAVTDTGQFDFGAGDFTLEGWFYASGLRGGANILTLFQKNNGTSTSGAGGPGIRVSDDGGGAISVYLSLSDGTKVTGVFTGDFRTSHTPGSGSWVHVALVRTTTKVKLYLNGVAAAQTGTDGDASSVTVGTKSILHAVDAFNIGANAHLDTAVGPGPVNYSTSWRGYIDEVRVSKIAAYTANFTPPAAQFPGYASPVVNDGLPYPIISNTGVLTVSAGSNVTVDDSDPQNIIISATGGSGGGGSFPLPDGCVAWFSTSHRHGVSAKAVNFLNAPVDGPQRGVVAFGATSVPVFAADGSVASGGIFTLNTPLWMGDCTILAVVKTPAALGSGGASTIFSGSAGSALQFRIENSGGTLALQLVKSSVAAIGDDVSSGSLGASTKILVGATLTGGAWTLRRNAAQTTSGTSANTPTSLNNVIGTNSGAGENAVHQLYDLAIFDRVLGSTDMATAETYLKTLNGL